MFVPLPIRLLESRKITHLSRNNIILRVHQPDVIKRIFQRNLRWITTDKSFLSNLKFTLTHLEQAETDLIKS